VLLSTSIPELLTDGSDHQFRQLIQDTMGFSIRFQALRAKIGELAGLSGPQYSLLIAVAHVAGGDITVNRLAERLHISATFVTAESNALKKMGLLAKRANPADGRSVLLGLTAKGHQLIEDVLPAVRELNDEIFCGCSRREFTILGAVMARLVHSIDDALAIAAAHCKRRPGAK
jgi:MarR family transcriptional regulator, organic hydroperoxide resistance regulator